MAIQYFATNRKTGDGTTTVWSFSFAGARPDANNGTEAYLEADDVRVATVAISANGEETRTPLNFVLGPGPAQVTVTPAVANGQAFVIYRETDSDSPVADFTDFASISEQDLDSGFRQTLFVVQESSDRVADASANAVNALTAANNAVEVAGSTIDTANNALSVANAASSQAGNAASAAATSVATANAAAEVANTALDTANDADATANAAQDAVAGAVSTANSAATAAGQAVSTANAANTAAGQATATANAANTAAATAVSTANAAAAQASEALGTANTASGTATDAEFKADQALEAAALIVDFQQQLDLLEQTVADLTGVEPGTIALNSENLSGLTDKAAARLNLDVPSTGEVNAANASQDSQIAANKLAHEQNTAAIATKAEQSIILTAGSGLSGGGDLTTDRSFAVDSTVVRTSRSITAGNGLSGGGTLAGNRTITLGTPGTLNGNSTNNVTTTGHTHAIDSTAARNDISDTTLLQARAMWGHIRDTSEDHDGRYYTKTQLDTRHQLVTGSSGTKTIMRTVPDRIVWFQTYKASLQLIGTGGANQRITFSSLQHDTNMWYTPSEWYNTAQHSFIAPIPGLYEFWANLVRAETQSGPNRDYGLEVAPAINGVPMTTSGPRLYAGRATSPDGDWNTDTAMQVSGKWIMRLEANDAVSLFAVQERFAIKGSSTVRDSFWGGRLL